jgi:hypothetical protein
MNHATAVLRRGGILAAILLTALALASTASAQRDNFEVDATITSTESFTYAQAAAPSPCRPWTQSIGTVTVTAHTKAPMWISSFRGGQLGRLRSERGASESKVERDVDYRRHSVSVTRKCFPCGPTREFGQCEEAKPDETGHEVCNPPAAKGQVAALLTRDLLEVWANVTVAPLLHACGKDVPAGIPLGADEPDSAAVPLKGVGRAIKRLQPGESARFKGTVRKGSGCKPHSGELEACTSTVAEVVISRIG